MNPWLFSLILHDSAYLYHHTYMARNLVVGKYRDKEKHILPSSTPNHRSLLLWYFYCGDFVFERESESRNVSVKVVAAQGHQFLENQNLILESEFQRTFEMNSVWMTQFNLPTLVRFISIASLLALLYTLPLLLCYFFYFGTLAIGKARYRLS